VDVHVDPSALARELASRLNLVLPLGTRLEADGPVLTSYGEDGRYSLTDVSDSLDGGDVDQDRLVYFVEAFLENVQTDVAHATRGTLWPYRDDRAGADPLATPWAKVAPAPGDLRFGYGESGPDFTPIRLADICV
jgi:hypothetical protein